MMNSHKTQEIKKHLIVLLPVSMANDYELAHMIHWMAFQKKCDVVYMTIEDCEEESLALSRDMATLKAATAGNGLTTQWIQAGPADWLSKLQAIYRPEDEIVCSEEQTIDRGLFGRVNLYRFVKELAPADLHLVSLAYLARSERKKKGIPEFLIWMGFLAIIALFTWLEIQVDAALHGPLSTIIVLGLLCGEFGAIYFWNSHTLS